MSRTPRRDLDVLVVGGGVVGTATAVLLATQAATAGLRVGLVEPRPAALPAAGTPWDLRVFALSRASQHVLEAAGVWDLVASRAAPYGAMRVWDAADTADGAQALRFAAAEIGEPDLGHIAEAQAIAAALQQAARAAGVRVFNAPLEGLEVTPDHARVTLAGAPAGEGVLRVGLVVGAEGADSTVRRLAGIEAEAFDYHQQGVVAFLATEREPQATAWQRFLPGGPVALLPVPLSAAAGVAGRAGCVSLVWSLPEEDAARMLALDDAGFAAAVTAASGEVLGALTPVSARAGFRLRRVTAARYAAARVALVGDAAHAVHPLAGQGANLGLLDAAALVECVAGALARGEDPGDAAPLGRYARWRRAEAAPVTLGVHAIQRLFIAGSPVVMGARRFGLGAVARLPFLRRLFTGRALGVAGEAPLIALGKPLPGAVARQAR